MKHLNIVPVKGKLIGSLEQIFLGLLRAALASSFQYTSIPLAWRLGTVWPHLSSHHNAKLALIVPKGVLDTARCHAASSPTMLRVADMVRYGEAQNSARCQSRQNCSPNVQDRNKSEHSYCAITTEANAASDHLTAADESDLLSGPRLKPI